MKRKPRVCKPNLTYRTYSRCINLENMMGDDSMKELMLTVIRETQDIFYFTFSGFKILDNDFHFLIKTLPSGESISKIMQRIKSVFARRYNKIHGRTGPVWNERFWSEIIEEVKNSAEYALKLLWYMTYTSYKKNMIHDPGSYSYCSIKYYLEENHKSKVLITHHEAFTNLGRTFKERMKAFLNFKKFYIKEQFHA